jgi:hypothetical protein
MENDDERKSSHNEENSKKIIITGTHNRYQIKKLTTEKQPPKKRTIVDTEWKNLQPNLLSFAENINNLKKLDELRSTEKKALPEDLRIFATQIERKLNSYKHQDIEKEMYDSNKLIKFGETIEKLIECELLCFYCKREMYILYEYVRENNQWTLDRIDNDIGHHCDNVIISCLECNLKRRRQNKDKFNFTKNLKINKSD